jgi:hypothetical protein
MGGGMATFKPDNAGIDKLMQQARSNITQTGFVPSEQVRMTMSSNDEVVSEEMKEKFTRLNNDAVLEQRLNSVKYHKPEGDAVAAHERLRAWAAGAVQFMEENVPNCREKSIVHTKLEETLMWAHKAIALNVK